MPFKSVRSSFGLSSFNTGFKNALVHSGVRRSWSLPIAFETHTGFIFLGVFFAGSLAHATLTVAPSRSDNVLLQNVPAGTSVAYYPAKNAAVSPAVTGPDVIDSQDGTMPERVYDLNAGVRNGDPDSPEGANLLLFNVTYDQSVSVTGDQKVVVVVMANGANGQQTIPIAYVNTNPTGGGGVASCPNSGICQDQDTSTGTNYYKAAQYTPKTTIQLGLYPSDICYYYYTKQSSQNAYGCSGVNPIPVASNTSGTNATMALTFYIYKTANSTGAPTEKVADGTTFSVRFQGGNPTPVCPSDHTNTYFPSDGAVLLNAQGFGISSSVDIAPPANKVIAVWNKGTPAVLATNYFAANQNLDRVDIGQEKTISPLDNTTTGADNVYQMGFMVRDFSGAVGISDTSACRINSVQASSIEGFLKKEGCFIATAAYQSQDAAPVMMLRQFRDRVLLKSGYGRKFVSWYYAWSPDAADWLVRNPIFRGPVLVALVPIEVIAFLCLNPLWLAPLLFGAGILFFTLQKRRARA